MKVLMTTTDTMEVAGLVVDSGLIVMATAAGIGTDKGLVVDTVEVDHVELTLSTWEDFRIQQMNMMFWK